MCLAYLVYALSGHYKFLGAVDTIYEYTYQLDDVRAHPHSKHNGQPQNRVTRQDCLTPKQEIQFYHLKP
jgi:hypothetical protein